jgi:hypothetical protein
MEADIVGPGLTVREMVEELREQARVEEAELTQLRSRWHEENSRRIRAGQPPLPEPPELHEGRPRGGDWLLADADNALAHPKTLDEGFEDGGGPVPEIHPETAPFCFRVDLTREVELGPDGGLRQTLWSALAHNHSEVGYNKAIALREAYKAELVARAEEDRLKEEAKLATELNAMAEILDVDMDDPKAVEASLSADWQYVRIETVSDSPDDTRETKLALLRFFPTLNDLYRHFCGNSMRGDSSSMQMQEFEHLLAVTGSLDVVREHKAVDAIFKQVNAGRKGVAEALGEDSMSRFEFIEAMLLIAKHRSRDRRSGLSPPCAECMHSLGSECLTPYWEKMGSGPVRRALKSRVVKKWMLHSHEGLRRVFDWYCKRGSRNSLFAQAKVLMDEEEFIMTLEHAGFLPPSSGSGSAAAPPPTGRRNLVTKATAREAFAGVQREDDGTGIPVGGGSSTSGVSAALSVQMEQLAFHEFIEAVARVGIQRWNDEFVPVESRIVWALEVVINLEKHLGRPPDVPLEVPDDVPGHTAPGAGRASADAAGKGAGLDTDSVSTVNALTAGLRPLNSSTTRKGPRRGLPHVTALPSPPEDEEIET